MAGPGSERREVGDEVMRLCSQWGRSYWHSGDVECYSEGDGNLMGAQVLAEEGLALEYLAESLWLLC